MVEVDEEVAFYVEAVEDEVEVFFVAPFELVVVDGAASFSLALEVVDGVVQLSFVSVTVLPQMLG